MKPILNRSWFYHHYTTPNTGPDSPSQLSSNYSYASFGRSGAMFWLLSSHRRYSDGVNAFLMNISGFSDGNRVFWNYFLRPTISLTFDIELIDRAIINSNIIRKKKLLRESRASSGRDNVQTSRRYGSCEALGTAPRNRSTGSTRRRRN